MTDHRPSQERQAKILSRRYRAVFSGAMLVSVLFHFLVLVLWPDAAILLLRESHPGLLRDRIEPPQLVRIATSASQMALEEAPPRVVRQPPDIRIQELPVSRPALDLSHAKPVVTADPVPPMRPVSSGSLMTEEEQYNQPIARNILPDWKFPPSLHGVTVTAHVFVDASGKSTGIVELVPPTPDQRVNDEIIRLVRRLKYQPALRNGKAVAEWAEITFVFCGKSVRATSPAAPRNLEAPCGPVNVLVAADSQ